MTRPALILHGGAGARPERNYDREIDNMRIVVEAMKLRLEAGASALDVAVEATVMLEDAGLYVAGRGASPNLAGAYELAIGDEAAWFTHAGKGEDNHPPGTAPDVLAGALAHGTVGCCVLDSAGRLAAATSTAGVFGKMPGRVGDTPIPGAGTWADGHVAVSGTGQGEYFIRTAACAQVSWRVAAGAGLEDATRAVITEIGSLGGDGGLIALDRDGRIAHPYNSQGMKRAWLTTDGEIGVEVFG